MTDPSLALPRASARPVVEARRARAFRSAARHSTRVRRLRRGLVGGVLVLVGGVVAATLFDPFGHGIGGVSIDGATVDGTKVTMTSPKLSGFQKDGRAYAIEAARAVQDMKAPTFFELHTLKARLTMADGSTSQVTAEDGLYDSTAETMRLSHGAHLLGDRGLDAVTADALVSFKTNQLSTDKPVSVTMPGKRIAADAMVIADGGKQVTFAGHVHTDIEPAAVSGDGSSTPTAP